MQKKNLSSSVFLSIVAATLLAVTGCGGGSEAKSTDSTVAKDGTTPAGSTDGSSSKGSSTGREPEAAERPEAPSGRPDSSGSAKPEAREDPDKSEAPSGPSRSGRAAKARFVKRAAGICTRGRKGMLNKIAAYYKGHQRQGASSNEAAVEALKAVFLPTIQRQIDQLRALDLPRGSEKQVEAILDSMQAAVETGRESPGKSASEISAPFAKPGKLARRYGLGACAYG